MQGLAANSRRDCVWRPHRPIDPCLELRSWVDRAIRACLSFGINLRPVLVLEGERNVLLLSESKSVQHLRRSFASSDRPGCRAARMIAIGGISVRVIRRPVASRNDVAAWDLFWPAGTELREPTVGILFDHAAGDRAVYP